MRSFSLVLLRRLVFRPAPTSTSQPTSVLAAVSAAPNRTTLYDHLSAQTLSTLERLLLFSLAHETAPGVRRKTVDTITDLAAQGMARGHAWHALQAQAFAMAHAGLEGHPGVGTGEHQQQQTAPTVLQRESAFRVFAGCPNLVMDLQIDAVLGVFQRGLKDQESIEVRHAALLASVNFLSAADATQLAQSISLLSPMLDTLVDLSNSLSQPPLGATSKTSNYHYLSTFLSTLTPLCATHPILFSPHLQSLLTFLPSLILPPVDCGPTPTVSRPFPPGGRSGAFLFPPPTHAADEDEEDNENGGSHGDADEERDERSTLRLSALEFMISLSEARPNMVRKVNGWTEVVVRACLEGMGEFDEDETQGLDAWLREDVSIFAAVYISDCFWLT